jgi:hypothetical protein
LSSHLRLLLSGGLFSPNFHTKTLYPSRLSPKCATCHVYLILLDSITRVKILKFLNVQFPSLSSDPVPIRPKYHPEHPILKHPQTMFISVRDQISRLYRKQAALFFCTFNLYIIEKSKGIHTILDRMVAGVICI